MAVTDAGLPFSGATTQSRHASHCGSDAAKERALPQVLRYLQLLQRRYPDGLTDREAAEQLGVERTTINARRGECMKADLIEPHGFREGKFGTDNTVWRLAR